jgi:c-di-GMP-binding flagellar brake protein YcgR
VPACDAAPESGTISAMSDREGVSFGVARSDRRRARRARMALSCTLRRRASSPIWAETIDIGEGGMSVRAARPLRADELVDFDLEGGDSSHVEGRARVVRHASPRVYGLQFETLPAAMQRKLHSLVQNQG